MESSTDDVARGIRLQNLMRDEFSKVDPDYDKQRYDERGNLVYGPTASFKRSGAVFDYELYGCGDRYEEFKAALIRVFDRFGRGEG